MLYKDVTTSFLLASTTRLLDGSARVLLYPLCWGSTTLHPLVFQLALVQLSVILHASDVGFRFV
jgi:hypothetical protein